MPWLLGSDPTEFMKSLGEGNDGVLPLYASLHTGTLPTHGNELSPVRGHANYARVTPQTDRGATQWVYEAPSTLRWPREPIQWPVPGAGGWDGIECIAISTEAAIGAGIFIASAAVMSGGVQSPSRYAIPASALGLKLPIAPESVLTPKGVYALARRTRGVNAFGRGLFFEASFWLNRITTDDAAPSEGNRLISGLGSDQWKFFVAGLRTYNMRLVADGLDPSQTITPPVSGSPESGSLTNYNALDFTEGLIFRDEIWGPAAPTHWSLVLRTTDGDSNLSIGDLLAWGPLTVESSPLIRRRRQEIIIPANQFILRMDRAMGS